MGATLLAPFQQETCHFLDEQRHPAGSLGHAVDHILAQSMSGGDFTDHMANLATIERHQGNRAVVLSGAPGRLELRPRGRQHEQRCQGAALGNALDDVDRGRIGPM